MITRALVVAFLLLPVAARAGAPDLAGYRWVQHPGAQLPVRLVLRDEAAHQVSLADIAQNRRPMILVFGYYQCPNLCGLVRSTLLTAIGASSLIAGRDYELAVVSIDPAETTSNAEQAKAADLAAFPLPGATHDWHYLTGSGDAIAALTDAAGYQGHFDAVLKQFIHPTGLVIVTPTGKVSSYLLGLGYHPGDLRVALAQASQGTVRAAAVPILLLCFHYDATTGRYTLSILKLLKLAAALTVVTVAGLGLVLFRREYQT
jgi:protein SCO1/2